MAGGQASQGSKVLIFLASACLAGCVSPPEVKDLGASRAIAEAQASAKLYKGQASKVYQGVGAKLRDAHASTKAAAARTKELGKKNEKGLLGDLQKSINEVSKTYAVELRASPEGLDALASGMKAHLASIDQLIAFLELLEREQAILSAYLDQDVSPSSGSVENLSAQLQSLAKELN